MKHSLIYCVFFALMFAITACGDDGDSATRPSEKSSSSVALSSLSSAGIAPMSSWSGGEAGTIGSSNSVVQSSSSESMSVVDPASVVKGTFSDSRDGQTYKTVTIGTQTWMAQNLNYETANSFCYSDTPSNCTKYGRLYTWGAAMDSAGTWSSNGKGCGFNKTCSPTYPVRGICPTGWHLPTKAEFEALFTAVGGESLAGRMLKSISGWNSGGNGTDSFSFSALSAGNKDNYGNYDGEGCSAHFWSSTEYSSDIAYGMYLIFYDDDPRLDYDLKDYAFSVRCVKD